MLSFAQLAKLNGTLYDSHLVLLLKTLLAQCPIHTYITLHMNAFSLMTETRST